MSSWTRSGKYLSSYFADTTLAGRLNRLKGKCSARQRQSRVGRNPESGTRLEVPAKKVHYFKPGKELKELVNVGGQFAEPKPGPDEAPVNR